MALDYVKAGEKVQASTVNSLVDAVTGLQNPSPDLVFTNTPRGTQLVLPSKFGGKNKPLIHYLDTGKYVLSSWQFVSLALGPTLDDCLGTIRLHTGDGETSLPISAAVIFKNSSESPTGDELSGYLLSADDFGKDAGAHAAGWVDTMIEDTNGLTPTRAELWAWEKPAKMAAVFTNVDSELSVKQQLSSILDDNGADGALSALERVGTWKLTSSTTLSVDDSRVPTHELVNTHGVIEVFEPSESNGENVNKAKLVCYYIDAHEDQQTGQKIIDNAKFAWLYWLGPDSAFNDENDSIKFVYSHSWTINGQPAVFKVEDEIDGIEDYEGNTVAVADERGGYSIMYGEFESNGEDTEEGEEGTINGGSLFVDFNFYDQYACMIGELGASNNSTASDLSKSTFLCQQRIPYTLQGEVAVGDSVPKHHLTYGTYSAVDKDWPLADTTCPEHNGSDQMEKKSIEWKDNVPEDDYSEPVDTTGTKSLQLYRFSEVVKSECDSLSDMQLSDEMVTVIRRVDNDGNAWIDYLNIDELSSRTVDSKCDGLYLSSVQIGAYTDNDGNEKNYYQLFGFEGNNIQLDRNNLDKFDLVVRDSNTPAQGAQVSYIPISSVLSTADVFTDTQVSQLSSIEYDDDGNGPYLQLYKFNDNEREDLTFNDFGRYDMVVRDNQDGHVDYATLSGMSNEIVSKTVDTLSVDVDSDLPPVCLSSIQEGSYVDEETDETHRYHQLFGFELSAEKVEYDKVGCYDVVLRDFDKDPDGAVVNYTPLSDLAFRPDSEGDSGQKSTSFLSATRDLQLYKFDEDGQGGVSSEVPVWWKPYGEALSDEILVRVGGAGGELQYKKLALKQAMLSVDRNTYGSQKSLQYAEIDNKTFLELNGFHANGSTLPKVTITSADTSLLPADNEFVIRKKVNGYWQIDYAPLSACISASVSATVSVDTDVVGTQRSIEWAEDNGQEYLQLYNMDMPDADPERVTITETGVAYHLLPDDYSFVVRTAQGGQIEYKDVSLCCMLSGGSPMVSCDTEKIQNYQSLDTVLTGNGAPYYQLHNFKNAALCAVTTTVKFADQPETADWRVGGGQEFVVRDINAQNGRTVNYKVVPLQQEHERVDANENKRSRSIQYASYDGCVGCYQALELYNFDQGCSNFVTSADISAESGNGILIRRHDGCIWYLDYMNFDSVDEMVKKYIGDYQLSQPPHNPYNYSTHVFWDSYDNKYAIELYNFQSGGSTANVTIHNDGCTYYWPQNSKEVNYSDYILVKHVDSSGNAELQYKQLLVQMPDIDVNQIEGDISYIGGEVTEIYGYLDDIWDALAELSGGLSSEYWEQGGSSSTCYGSSIGNSGGTTVIDLDNQELVSNNGYWYIPYIYSSGSMWANEIYVGSTHFDSSGTAFIAGSTTIGCDMTVQSNLTVTGCVIVGTGSSIEVGGSYVSSGGAYIDGTLTINSGCTLTIGATSLSEQQLQRLLALI